MDLHEAMHTGRSLEVRPSSKGRAQQLGHLRCPSDYPHSFLRGQRGSSSMWRWCCFFGLDGIVTTLRLQVLQRPPTEHATEDRGGNNPNEKAVSGHVLSPTSIVVLRICLRTRIEVFRVTRTSQLPFTPFFTPFGLS